MERLTGLLMGTAHPKLERITDRLSAMLRRDPDLSFQIAAYSNGAAVLDAWGGPHMLEDSLIVPYSVSKNTIGVTIGLLVERGQLDLDATVASYWPEFAAAGKQRVTVRQLLSHQAGIPEASPRLTWDELFDDHAAAARLADTVPFWLPGSAFGYHGLVIGNLAGELVFRVTGRTIQSFYESEVRSVIDAEFYLGLPSNLEGRRVDVLPMIPPLAEYPAPVANRLGDRVLGPRPGPSFDLANGERSWRFGHPAVSSVASARGIAKLLAGAVTGVGEKQPLLSAHTVAMIGQQQVRGYDEVLAMPDRAHAIVFQKPNDAMPWGGPRSFGHDGAAGTVGCVDPETGLAFGFTIVRGPWPGGADPRAIEIVRDMGKIEF